MAVSKGFAYAYGWNVYNQFILGFCSESGEGLIGRQRAWAWAALMIVSNWVPRTASLPLLWGDLNSIINCLSTNLSIACSIAKIVALRCQRSEIGSILSAIDQDWTISRSNEEIGIMSEPARTSRFLSIMSVSLTNAMFVSYILGQIYTMLKIGNAHPRLAFGCLFESYFPFETTNPLVFVPIWVGQFFSTLVSMVSYSGTDCIISMMVLHLCGQLRIIRHSLKNLVDETTAREPRKYWRTLIPIVKRHNELNQLSFVIKETFSSILLAQMLVCSVTFCFQGYVMFTTLMDRNGEPVPIHNLGFSFLYAGFTIIHLFVHCYVGDRLLVESTQIPDDFYESPWYNLAPEEAKAFLLICQRSNMPLELTAGKFCTFNLQLFNAILKNSMGYLSMLMAMKERLID